MSKELVQIRNFRDYAQCPEYSKYNWNVPSVAVKLPAQVVIESCYRDIAVLNKRVDWSTIRSRVQAEVMKQSTKTAQQIYGNSVELLTSLRAWYLEQYRDGIEEAVFNLKLSTEMGKTKIEADIFCLLVSETEVTLIDFVTGLSPEEILKDIGLRIKIYLLGKQNIKVNKILAIRPDEKSARYWTLTVNNSDNWNYKTEQVLQLMLASMNNNIFYPSPTGMCSTCKYKGICSW